jgi:predicted solute-binding protein
MRVGVIKFSNALPIFYALCQKIIPNNLEFIYGPPVRINAALRKGEVDAALIGSEEYLSASDLYLPFLPYGVAASDRIISVRLFWKGSINELNGRTIFVPTISSTSVRLLKILCHNFWHVRPQFRTFTGDPVRLLAHHPVLVIGDQCLKLLPNPSIDLATSWYEATKKGFIFSLVAARTEMKNKDPAALNHFESLLGKSLQWTQAHYSTIIRQAQRGTHCRRNLMSVYYSTIHHHLTDEHRAGFSLFSSYQM